MELKKESSTAKAITMLALLPFLIIYGVWAWACVMVSVWNWFMVATFQLQPICFKQAVAISAVIGLFFIRNTLADKVGKISSNELSWDKIGNGICFGLVAPWVTWCIYWVTKAIFI